MRDKESLKDNAILFSYWLIQIIAAEKWFDRPPHMGKKLQDLHFGP